jgi:hypothetical protein
MEVESDVNHHAPPAEALADAAHRQHRLAGRHPASLIPKRA